MWAFIFVGAGALVLIYGFGLVRDARACAQWPMVEGRVASVEAQVVSRETNKTTYAPNVTYHYLVNGKRYESSRLTLVPRTYRSLQIVNEILARYPVDSVVTVFHDPKDPANCLLVTTSTGSEWAFPIAGILMIGTGLLFLRR